jgi:hypothetical protein
MSAAGPPPRLHLLAAKKAPIVIILRRGPSKLYHCVKYNTETDVVEHGSWFNGKLYHFRCDVSHDGEHMVYLAMGSKGETWNGVCRPPWLKCIYTWETMGTWHGGGLWLSSTKLARNLGLSDDKPERNPEFKNSAKNMSFVDHNSKEYGEDEGVLYDRLLRDGWKRQGPFGTEVKLPGTSYQVAHENDSGWLMKSRNGWPPIQLFYRGYFKAGRSFEFQMDDHPEFFSRTDDWVTFDELGHLNVARNGYVEKWARHDLDSGSPSFVIDLNNLAPPNHESLDKKTSISDLNSEHE